MTPDPTNPRTVTQWPQHITNRFAPDPLTVSEYGVSRGESDPRANIAYLAGALALVCLGLIGWAILKAVQPGKMNLSPSTHANVPGVCPVPFYSAESSSGTWCVGLRNGNDASHLFDAAVGAQFIIKQERVQHVGR